MGSASEGITAETEIWWFEVTCDIDSKRTNLSG